MTILTARRKGLLDKRHLLFWKWVWYLGKFLLGMCRYPLKIPTPLQFIQSVADYRRHLSHFW